MYKFLKIKYKDIIFPHWVCLIEDDIYFKEYLKIRAKEIFDEYLKAKKINKSGMHFDTSLQVAMDIMFRNHLDNKNVFDDVNTLDSVYIKVYTDTYSKYGKIYIAPNGAINLFNDEDIEIIETRESKRYVFPDLSHLTSVEAFRLCKIVKWEGGSHYYVTLCGTSIIHKNQTKWNTEQQAEDAAYAYCKENFKLEK